MTISPVDRPFEAVLIDHYHPSCVQDTPNKLDEEIKARLLSPENQWVYLDPDEIEKLNNIFGENADKGEFDVYNSSFDDTLRFYLKSIARHFALNEGEDWYDEEKNKLPPSTILSKSDKLEVTCAPPVLFLARMINYANQVNPDFKHIHAFLTGTLADEKGRKRYARCHHGIVGVVDTENRRISFIDPYILLMFPFLVPHLYNADSVITSERRELIGAWAGSITSHGPSGLSWTKFLEESRRNLNRHY